MGQERDQQNRVTFKDVLLARRYLEELHDTGKLSPNLWAAVEKRGRVHVERVAGIVGRIDKRHSSNGTEK
jgi:hypothetical protein